MCERVVDAPPGDHDVTIRPWPDWSLCKTDAFFHPGDSEQLHLAHGYRLICHHGDGWRIYVQGTGQLLATLPEQVSIAHRFVRRAEQIAFGPHARYGFKDFLDPA